MPESNGRPITLYYVDYYSSERGAAQTITTDKQSVKLTGLQKNTLYSVRCRAQNSMGISAYSSSILVSTLPTAPSQPLPVTDKVGWTLSRQIGFSWTAPADTGGAPLANWTGRVSQGDQEWHSSFAANGTHDFKQLGLEPFRDYYAQVKVSNAEGLESAYSGLTNNTHNHARSIHAA